MTPAQKHRSDLLRSAYETARDTHGRASRKCIDALREWEGFRASLFRPVVTLRHPARDESADGDSR